MKVIADQDAKKAKKVFHHRRLRYLANNFKSGKTYKKDMDTQKRGIVQGF